MSAVPKTGPIAIAETEQSKAAHPGASVWVSASAGSGKTKVLTDRVLALLLAGAAPERLLSVECACAASATPHRTETKGGMSAMDAAGPLVVPAHGKLVFSPNGLHIMLAGLKSPLKAGGMQEMTLRFEHAGAVKAGFHIKDVIGAPAGAMADMPGMKP